jgi:hypothetical protein
VVPHICQHRTPVRPAGHVVDTRMHSLFSRLLSLSMLLRTRKPKIPTNDGYEDIGWPDGEPLCEVEAVLRALSTARFTTRRFCDVDAALAFAFFGNKTERKDMLIPASPSQLQISNEDAFRIHDLLRSCFDRTDEDLFTRGTSFAEQLLKMNIVGLRSRLLTLCMIR